MFDCFGCSREVWDDSIPSAYAGGVFAKRSNSRIIANID
jgi:hypothetical protein